MASRQCTGMKIYVCSATILAVALLVSGCGRRVAVSTPRTAQPSPVTTAESLYMQGLSAFHRGTPDAYTEAAEAFRAALKLNSERCEYRLNLAQSLIFLATEQLLNWEEFEPRQAEAKSIVESAEPTCGTSHE